MNKESLKEYADLKIQQKTIEARIKELGPVIKSEIEAAGADKIDSDFGTFSLIGKPVWKFSPAVDELETKVDELKAEEKATGVATETIRKDLVFKAKVE